MTTYNACIVRYGEISLKGKNRIMFERRLKEDIIRYLNSKGAEHTTVTLRRGRIYIRGIDRVPDLTKVMGIYSYSPALEIEKNLDTLKQAIIDFIPRMKEAANFRVSCQRVDKKFQPNSIELERMLGALVVEHTQLPVKLVDPVFNLEVEIGEDFIYIFSGKIKGFGGLPFGTAGRLLSLISSGIDSPVATFMMMKRGVEPVLLHYRVTEDDFRKVLLLKEKLEEYASGRELKLLVVDRDQLFDGKFAAIYNNRKFHSYVCVMCKYLMHKRAGEEARKTDSLGLITGDNISQVASQTLENLRAYRNISDLPVYSPLIAFDKEDTIGIAKRIGTYEISIQKAAACVPPKSPKTRVKPELFHKILKESGLAE